MDSPSGGNANLSFALVWSVLAITVFCRNYAQVRTLPCMLCHLGLSVDATARLQHFPVQDMSALR